MMRIAEVLRARQWYKNLVVFLPIIFGQQLVNTHLMLLTLVGFFSLCFVSSANYIINDLVDRKEDVLHPEKKCRPIASGRTGAWTAILIASLMLLLSLLLGFFLSLQFIYFVVALFLLSQIYNFWLKREAFADILLIAVNFVLRAVSGAYVITHGSNPYEWVSPWLILCPFFLSLFISVGKRESDALLLGKNAGLHRRVLALYTKEITKPLMYISTTLLVVSYSLYSFLSINPQLLYTLPAALYVIFRYLYLVENGSPIARHPETAYTDRRLMIGIAVWVLAVLVVLY
jgi:4-hydroxybenzoate polyprenyltransferase